MAKAQWFEAGQKNRFKRNIFSKRQVPYLIFFPFRTPSIGRVVRVSTLRPLHEAERDLAELLKMGIVYSVRNISIFLESFTSREEVKRRKDLKKKEKLREAKCEITFEEFSHFFLKIYGGKMSRSLKEMHKENLRRANIFFKNRSLKSIRSVDINDFISYLEDESSSVVVSSHLRTIRAVLEVAVEHGYLKKNPADFIFEVSH